MQRYPTTKQIVILATLLSMVTAPTARAAGNAENGLKLARQWCASCHEIQSKTSSSDAVPAFSEIARRRDHAWIKTWLTNPHPPMTGIGLSRNQIDDLTAYLQSLAPPRSN